MKNTNKLLVIFISIIISIACFFGFAYAIAARKEPGTGLELRVEFKAKQEDGKSVVTAELFMDYETLVLSPRTNGRFILGGNVIYFDTPSYNFGTSGTMPLASNVVEYERDAGQTINVLCEVSFDVDGDGTESGNMTLSKEFVLNDEVLGIIPETEAEETTASIETEAVTEPETTAVREPFSGSYELTGDNGKLNLRAVISAKDSETPGMATVTAELYLDHYSIDLAAWNENCCKFTVGGKTVEFPKPAIKKGTGEKDKTRYSTQLQTLTTEAKIGDTVKVSAEIWWEGVYDGKYIDYLKLDKEFVLK